ncbi:hypothetical protein [Nocardia transvalensis]|uniref:hypothetical protein n=1 Tax=Nocardia transvalensis TaxID=37333 RepID=UPI0018938EF9|nr:hypothetical protein [Nocardia transvalensis]MBF6333623.1 hypothetical protein [Nocardia transvalensis]
MHTATHTWILLGAFAATIVVGLIPTRLPDATTRVLYLTGLAGILVTAAITLVTHVLPADALAPHP